MVARGLFREDLLSRLSGFTLSLPPLRARREDLGILIRNALARDPSNGNGRVSFSLPAIRQLLRHSWPRNIRELQKSVETALVLARDAFIDLQHLPAELRNDAQRDENPKTDEAQRKKLIALLAEHDGNISAVARELGKDRVQVRRWLRQYDIDPTSYRDQ